MNKNLILRLALAGVLAFSLHSCRAEDELIPSTQEALPLFETFTSKNGESVNYPHGYRNLLEKYDSIHGGIHTRKAIIKNRKTGKAVSTEYIELSIRSQELMVKDNSERWILYPMVKDRNVTGIAVGILKNGETSLEFWSLDPEDAYYKEIINLFRLAYAKKLMDEGTASKGGGCGWNEESPCNTGEVIINVPKPAGPKGDPNLYLPGGGGSDPGVIGGGCEMYGDCGGGGSSGSNPTNNTDPCAKMKLQNKDSNFKNKTEYLKSKTGATSESGFRVGNPVPGSGQTGAQYQELSNKPGSTDIDFKIFNTTYGIMHSHYDGLVPIFSPGDINLFIQLLKNAKANNISSNEVFLSVVTSQGVYQLRGDGINIDNLSMYSQTQIDALNTIYLEKMGSSNISTENLQKEFLKFMKTNMNIDGAKLYETNSDGTNKQLLLNGNNLSTPNCP